VRVAQRAQARIWGLNLPRFAGDFRTRFDLSDREVFVAAPRKYPDELRERVVRLYRDADPKPVIRRLAEQLSVHPEALRNWIRQDQADRGERDDQPTTEMIEENRRLRREVAELKRVNEVLRAASAYFAAEIDPTRRSS
jgi:transposase